MDGCLCKSVKNCQKWRAYERKIDEVRICCFVLFPGSVCSVKASGPSINSFSTPATLTFSHISLACYVIWLGYETDHAAAIQSQVHSEAWAHTLLIAPVTSYTALFKCREFIWHFRHERWFIEQIQKIALLRPAHTQWTQGHSKILKIKLLKKNDVPCCHCSILSTQSVCSKYLSVCSQIGANSRFGTIATFPSCTAAASFLEKEYKTTGVDQKQTRWYA